MSGLSECTYAFAAISSVQQLNDQAQLDSWACDDSTAEI